MSFLKNLISKKDKHHGSLAMVFDIGSASVGGSLVVLGNGVPRVIYNTRRGMVLQEELDFKRFVSSMFQALEGVVEQIQRKGFSRLNQNNLEGMPVSQALFMYSSPWYSAQTSILNVQKEKPFTVDRSFIDDLVQKEEEKLAEKQKGNVIERAVTSILLNGYEVQNIEDKEVTHLQLTFSRTAVPNQVAGGLEDILLRTAHTNKIIHHSFPLTAFAAVRDVFSEHSSFLLLDVSGEVSDLSLISENVLVETVSFPKGTHFALREIASEMSVPMETARSMLRMHDENTLDMDTDSKLMRTMERVQSEWARDFKNAIHSVKSSLQMPIHLFFITNPYFTSILEDAVALADTDKVFEAKRIGYSTLRDQVVFADVRTYDPFIGIGAFFLSKTL